MIACAILGIWINDAMAKYDIRINGISQTVDALPDSPLLWVLRDGLELTGTKFGCGIAQCGACTVFLDGKPLRSCSLPISAVGSREITTIEGLHGREADAVRTFHHRRARTRHADRGGGASAAIWRQARQH